MNYYYRLVVSRFKALDSILILLALISIELVIWTENANTNEDYIVVLKIMSRLGYSYLSAFIFYLLVVFLPKERRQSYLYLGISNNIIGIGNKIYNILLTIKFTGRADIKMFAELQDKSNMFELKEVLEISKKINPMTPPRILGETRFVNWYEYLTFESKLLKQQLNRLSQFYPDLNPEIIELAEKLFLNVDSLDFGGKTFGNNTLEHCFSHLNDLYKASMILNDAYKRNYREKYHFEFSKRSKKFNKSLNL